MSNNYSDLIYIYNIGNQHKTTKAFVRGNKFTLIERKKNDDIRSSGSIIGIELIFHCRNHIYNNNYRVGNVFGSK